MRETKIYCDHCGKELDEMHDYTGMEFNDVAVLDCDLCKECMDKLDKLIREFVHQEKEN